MRVLRQWRPHWHRREDRACGPWRRGNRDGPTRTYRALRRRHRRGGRVAPRARRRALLPRRNQADRRKDFQMRALDQLRLYLDECPLVGIIRGVTPDEAEAIGEALFDAGIRIIEVPLNSPEPLKSIEKLAAKFGDRALVGGGTVLKVGDVANVRASGGRLIVSPNTNTDVVAAAASEGLVSMPGYFTPSEAFAALDAGATALKLFPAEGASPSVLKAQLAVIPKDVPIFAVGGISPDNMLPWRDAGASGFGLGSGLYKPGQSAAETAEKARAYVAGLKR